MGTRVFVGIPFQSTTPFPAAAMTAALASPLLVARPILSSSLVSHFGITVSRACERRRPPFRVQAGFPTQIVEEEASSNLGSEDVRQSVLLLKTAAKTKKVPPSEVFEAFRTLEMAKLDVSDFLQLIGGTESPGRTWLLVFVASAKLVREALKGGMGGGQYFPVTAVQRFDATARRIENGIFLGPIGYLTFDGRFSWKKTILSFVFENLNIKIGSLGPFKFNIAKKEDEDRTPGTKDPFFNWLYADEEIIVARGRGGGIAFWCRCTKVY